MTKIISAITHADLIPLYYNITGKKIPVLISYYYAPGQLYKIIFEHKQEMIKELYLDCGGYSARNKNILITLSEYKKFFHMFGHHFDFCFNLDDDFNNPDHNFNNQVFLENGLPDGLKRPIPVIHDEDDPFKEIETYVAQDYDYLAIGSNKKLSDDTWKKIKDKFPDLKLHMFGNLNRKMLSKYKPYSADSADYAHRAGYGYIYYYDPNDDKEYSIYLGEMEDTKGDKIHFSNFHNKKELEGFLHDEFKFGYDDLLKSTYNKYIVNLHYFRQLEDMVNAS